MLRNSMGWCLYSPGGASCVSEQCLGGLAFLTTPPLLYVCLPHMEWGVALRISELDAFRRRESRDVKSLHLSWTELSLLNNGKWVHWCNYPRIISGFASCINELLVIQFCRRFFSGLKKRCCSRQMFGWTTFWRAEMNQNQTVLFQTVMCWNMVE